MVVSERCWFTFMMVVLILNFYWFFAIHLYPYPQLLLLLSRSHVRLFATPGTAAYQASLFFPVSLNLLKSMSIESVMLCNHLILCHPLLFCLLSFPEPCSFPMSWLFTSGGQSIGASALASVLPMNIQGWFPLGLTGLIFLLSNGLSRFFSSNSVWKINSLVLSHLYGPTFTSVHDYWIKQCLKLFDYWTELP